MCDNHADVFMYILFIVVGCRMVTNKKRCARDAAREQKKSSQKSHAMNKRKQIVQFFFSFFQATEAVDGATLTQTAAAV